MVDSAFRVKLIDDTMEQNIAHQLLNVVPDNDNYKILPAHRPEYFDVYAGKVDLVLSGHAHGGQFIIPFIGGLVAPLLGGVGGGGPEFKVNIDGNNVSMNFNLAGQTIYSAGTNGGISSDVGAWIVGS